MKSFTFLGSAFALLSLSSALATSPTNREKDKAVNDEYVNKLMESILAPIQPRGQIQPPTPKEALKIADKDTIHPLLQVYNVPKEPPHATNPQLDFILDALDDQYLPNDDVDAPKSIWRTAEVENSRLNEFCTQSEEDAAICQELKEALPRCQASEDACQDNDIQHLLRRLVKEKPCDTAPKDGPTKATCDKWFTEAHRCVFKARKKPCGHHHLLYLLREIREFLDLDD